MASATIFALFFFLP